MKFEVKYTKKTNHYLLLYRGTKYKGRSNKIFLVKMEIIMARYIKDKLGMIYSF